MAFLHFAATLIWLERNVNDPGHKALTAFVQTQPLRLFWLGRRAVSHDGFGRDEFTELTDGVQD